MYKTLFFPYRGRIANRIVRGPLKKTALQWVRFSALRFREVQWVRFFPHFLISQWVLCFFCCFRTCFRQAREVRMGELNFLRMFRFLALPRNLAPNLVVLSRSDFPRQGQRLSVIGFFCIELHLYSY